MRGLELKKVRIHDDMSEETICFSAEIWLEGKPVGPVRNEGRGGSHSYYFTDREAEQRIIDHVKMMPDDKVEHDGVIFTVSADIDLMIGKMLEKHSALTEDTHTVKAPVHILPEELCLKFVKVVIKNGAAVEMDVPKGVILQVVDKDSQDGNPEVRHYGGPDTHFSRLKGQVECCEFIALSKLLPPLSELSWFWCAISENAPFSWGDNNRTLITASRFAAHCRDRLEDYPECKDWLKTLDKLGETYIDLEN